MILTNVYDMCLSSLQNRFVNIPCAQFTPLAFFQYVETTDLVIVYMVAFECRIIKSIQDVACLE